MSNHRGHDMRSDQVMSAAKRIIDLLLNNPSGLYCNKHHRVPRSRYKDFNLDGNFAGNVLRLPKVQHDAYHQLFGERIAEEVISLFKNGWWPSTREARTRLRLACPHANTRAEVIRHLENFWSVRESNKGVWQAYICKHLSE